MPTRLCPVYLEPAGLIRQDLADRVQQHFELQRFNYLRSRCYYPAQSWNVGSRLSRSIPTQFRYVREGRLRLATPGPDVFRASHSRSRTRFPERAISATRGTKVTVPMPSDFRRLVSGLLFRTVMSEQIGRSPPMFETTVGLSYIGSGRFFPHNLCQRRLRPPHPSALAFHQNSPEGDVNPILQLIGPRHRLAR